MEVVYLRSAGIDGNLDVGAALRTWAQDLIRTVKHPGVAPMGTVPGEE